MLHLGQERYPIAQGTPERAVAPSQTVRSNIPVQIIAQSAQVSGPALDRRPSARLRLSMIAEGTLMVANPPYGLDEP